MVNKFVFVIAGIVIVMGALIALPNLIQQPTTSKDMTIEYNRQHQSRTGGAVSTGLIVTRQLETLSIDKDGLATYTKTGFDKGSGTSSPRHSSLSREQFGKIKALILETGFMDIPKSNFPDPQNATNFVAYTLTITTPSKQKTISWAQAENADNGNQVVPPIVTNVGTQLDGVIAAIQ